MKFKVNTTIYFTYPETGHIIQGVITNVSSKSIKVMWSYEGVPSTYSFDADRELLGRFITTCTRVE